MAKAKEEGEGRNRAPSIAALAKIPLAEWQAYYQELEIKACSEDVVYWFTKYAWADDPRKPGTAERFVPWPKQVEFLRWLEERERSGLPEAGRGDGLVEKCRDWGVTCLCCGFALHRWLWRPGTAVGFGSRKLELVDNKGDPKCIFEKIRFLLYHLPAWIMPPGFKRDRHDTEAKLVHPSNGCTITGEGGENVGRGGRYSIYFPDEKAFMPHADSVDRALSQATRVQIDISTPNGVGNNFERKRFSGRVPVFICDWRDDPRKNHRETGADGREIYPWFEAQKRAFDAVTVAQEIERDYSASMEGVAIPAVWVRAAVGLELPGFDQHPVEAGLDIAAEGKDDTVLCCRRGPVVQPLIVWGQQNTTQTAWRVRDHGEKLGIRVCVYEHSGVGAGVKGTWDSAREKLAFHPRPVNTGAPPTEDRWPDGKTSKDKFLNLRAELWWKLRCRFEKAYEYREQGVAHPLDELVSIPADNELIGQLSSVKVERSANGKLKVESKKDMKSRGVKSPDRADALVLCFHHGDVSIYQSRGLLVLRAKPVPATPEATFSSRLVTIGADVPAMDLEGGAGDED